MKKRLLFTIFILSSSHLYCASHATKGKPILIVGGIVVENPLIITVISQAFKDRANRHADAVKRTMANQAAQSKIIEDEWAKHNTLINKQRIEKDIEQKNETAKRARVRAEAEAFAKANSIAWQTQQLKKRPSSAPTTPTKKMGPAKAPSTPTGRSREAEDVHWDLQNAHLSSSDSDEDTPPATFTKEMATEKAMNAILDTINSAPQLDQEIPDYDPATNPDLWKLD